MCSAIASVSRFLLILEDMVDYREFSSIADLYVSSPPESLNQNELSGNGEYSCHRSPNSLVGIWFPTSALLYNSCVSKNKTLDEEHRLECPPVEGVLIGVEEVEHRMFKCV